MRIRFSDPVDGGHEVAVLVVRGLKFLDSLVIAQTGTIPGIGGQTVIARFVDNGFRLVPVGPTFFRCEILPSDEPDLLEMTPDNR